MAGSGRDNPDSNDSDSALDKVLWAAVESIPPVASYQSLETVRNHAQAPIRAGHRRTALAMTQRPPPTANAQAGRDGEEEDHCGENEALPGAVMDRGGGMNIDHGRLDDLRRGRGPIQEHVIDEFVAGRLSRRDFLRRAARPPGCRCRCSAASLPPAGVPPRPPRPPRRPRARAAPRSKSASSRQ